MKSTTTPTMTSGEREREVEIDRILGTARAAWRAGIERDERTTRHWSERRLARTTGPEGRRRSAAKGAERNGLAVAVCIGACALGALTVRRLRPVHEDAGIRPDPSAAVVVSAETPAVLPGTEPAAAQPSAATPPAAPSVAEPEANAPVALSWQEPSSPPVPRSKSASTDLPPLPPLPPPAPEAAPLAKVRRVTVGAVDPDGAVRIEVRSRKLAIPPSPPPIEAHRALRAARQELGRGEVERARERLRALVGQGDPPLVFEAARALARTHRDPKEQLVVWDQALPRLVVEPYRSLAAAERARVIARARDGGT